MDEVILVDPEDRAIGTMEKLEAHQRGVLHRAFSILVYNSRGEILLQKRAGGKYHSSGLWTNTCCSHPAPGEPIEQAAHRRLREEMGFDTPLTFSHKFIYRAQVSTDLTEYELDHVFTGTYDEAPLANPKEVSDWKFMSPASIREDMKLNPGRYTHWFRIIMQSDERERQNK